MHPAQLPPPFDGKTMWIIELFFKLFSFNFLLTFFMILPSQKTIQSSVCNVIFDLISFLNYCIVELASVYTQKEEKNVEKTIIWSINKSKSILIINYQICTPFYIKSYILNVRLIMLDNLGYLHCNPIIKYQENNKIKMLWQWVIHLIVRMKSLRKNLLENVVELNFDKCFCFR